MKTCSELQIIMLAIIIAGLITQQAHMYNSFPAMGGRYRCDPIGIPSHFQTQNMHTRLTSKTSFAFILIYTGWE